MAKKTAPAGAAKRRPPKPPALDPVTQYATDVAEGRIVASRMVRLACERHLRDLEEADDRGLVWRPEKADEPITFFEQVLCLPDIVDDQADSSEAFEDDARAGAGRPFILQPFQKFIIGSLFGWYRTDGRRRFRVAYVETSKGSGKTPTAAGLGLYRLIIEARRGAQIYAAAVKLDQAKLCFTDAENIVAASPELAALVADGTIDHHVNNLSLPATGSFFRPISSEKKGLDGKRVHTGLIDELHEHDTNVVDEKMRAGTKGVPDALIFKITNSGFNRQTVCWHNHEMSRQVLEGTIENDAWFAFVCHLDPCDACYGKGYRQPNDSCESCDRWDVEGPHWLKANPNLGVSITWDYLREQVAEAIGMPSKQNIVKRLNFSIWTESETIWIPSDKWDACGADDLSQNPRELPAVLRGRECFIGVDLSSKIDLSSAVALFPRPLGSDEMPLDLGLAPDAATTGDPETPTEDRVRFVDFGVDVWPLFWVPKLTMTERVKKDRVPYDQWEREGYLEVTGGPMIDQALIWRRIEAISKMALVQGLAFDPTNAGQLATWSIAEFGKERVFDIQQGFRHLSEPSKVFEALVIAKRLRHPRNKVLTWNVSNVAKEENSWQDIRPIKTSAIKRIDGVVALILGLRIALMRPLKKRSRYARGGAPILLADGRRIDGVTGEELR